MEREYRGMTTNEVIEQIKAGHISFADIADYLNDRTDAERRNFCFRMFCSIPMEPITISMESFRDYDAIPYSKKHKPSYHELKSTGLTPQQESEKDRLLEAIGFIESKYGVDLFGEYQDERTFKPTDDEDKATFEALNEKRIQSNEPQQDKGKAIEKYVTINKKEMIIQAIKNLTSGKKGKSAAVIIAVAVADGYINKPTFDILKEAFGITGSRQAFNKAYSNYVGKGDTYKHELSAAKEALKKVIEELE